MATLLHAYIKLLYRRSNFIFPEFLQVDSYHDVTAQTSYRVARRYTPRQSRRSQDLEVGGLGWGGGMCPPWLRDCLRPCADGSAAKYIYGQRSWPASLAIYILCPQSATQLRWPGLGAARLSSPGGTDRRTDRGCGIA